jgi:hypothetical protein
MYAPVYMSMYTHVSVLLWIAGTDAIYLLCKEYEIFRQHIVLCGDGGVIFEPVFCIWKISRFRSMKSMC